jgi:hypothetical protein
MLMYPWQVLRGVELRADTFRLWAREHRTRWSFRLNHPHFEAATESPDLGQALCDLARVCAVMAEPFGVPAGRVSSDVPGVIPGGPRPLPPVEDGPSADAEVEAKGDGSNDTGGKDDGKAEESADGAQGNRDAEQTPVPIGLGEELIELPDEDKAAVPTRSDDQG